MANPRISANAAPRRLSNGWLIGTTIAIGFAVSMIPVVGPIVSHFIERFSNHVKAKRELDARADWYRDQIASTLHMEPRKVRGKHLEQAAAINPVLAAAVKDVRREESKENKSSAMINTAVAFIPGGGLIKEGAGAVKAATVGAKTLAGAAHLGKTVAVVSATGLIANWTTKEHVSAQEVIEGISSQLEAAKAQGLDPKTVVTPQMVFFLRVAQDEALGKQIAQQYKKPFQKMNEFEQTQVMHQYVALANATASEATLITQGTPVQELMAHAPDLNNTAQYSVGAQDSTFFRDHVAAERKAALSNVGAGRALAANDGSHVARIQAERLAAAQMANARQA